VLRLGWLGTIANYIERGHPRRSAIDPRNPGGVSAPCSISWHLIADQVGVHDRHDTVALPVRQMTFAI